MLKLTLFGSFSIEAGGVKLTEDEKSSPRVFRALLYLLANRNKRIALRDFSAFLREGKAYTATASYAAGSDSLVKTTLHRIRALLAPLQKEEPALRILCRDGAIRFDPELLFSADTDRFNELLAELKKIAPLREKEPDRALFLFRSLASLYHGKYLSALSGEEWVIPEAKRYHDSYVTLCEDYFPLLFHLGYLDELIDMASHSIAIDPYIESFHYWKIRAFAQKGEKALALMLYEGVEKLFGNSFHIRPSARLRRLRQTLAFSPTAPSASHALTELLSQSSREPLSPEAFSALLRFAKQTKEAEELVLLLLTLPDPDQSDAVLSLFEKTDVPGVAYCRYSATQYLFLLSNGEAKTLSEILKENKLMFSIEEIALSDKK